MTRTLLKDISRALKNQVILPFHISDFEALKKDIPLNHERPFRTLVDNPTRLTIEGGPAVVTDLNGVPVLWYFPNFIGKGLQTNLLNCIDNLAHTYRPPRDADIRDRRGTSSKAVVKERPAYGVRYVTRSQAARLTATEAEELIDDQEKQAEITHGSVCVLEQPADIPDCQPPPEAYKDCEGEVRLDYPQIHPIGHPSKQSEPAGSPKRCALAEYESFAYYLSPGWCQTGMQNVRPIQMSLHFRNILQQAPDQTVEFLEAKRLLDKKISQLTDIIHPWLGEKMRILRSKMSSIQGPTQVAVVNGWTSAFPCFGVAINRVTGIHRDQRGMRGGLDIIGVLGTFTEGGDLDLPDLNLRVEWTPGCLGAFDGYDFRHRVQDWDGGSRVTLISFCQKATWSALGLDSTLIRPTIEDCRDLLSSAWQQRSDAIQKNLSDDLALKARQKSHQLVEHKLSVHDRTTQSFLFKNPERASDCSKLMEGSLTRKAQDN